MIEGIASVDLTKNNQTLSGPISSYPFLIQVYKDGGDVDVLFEATDDNGKFRVEFTPKEPGYYKMVWKSGYDWLPIEYPFLDDFLFYFYVSERDSDDDGVPDKYDYDPYDPNIQSRGDVKAPAFEAIFVIAGLLAVAYLLRRRR
ncbi:MAG: PGF-CTERM sorting domain-containing protein [Methanophagales archaeon]|nr:PGF-CTERM sorting domain-containing protein [Methanophagales archaeon]